MAPPFPLCYHGSYPLCFCYFGDFELLQVCSCYFGDFELLQMCFCYFGNLCIMILVSETELPGIKKIKQEIKNSAQIMSTRNIYIDKKKECAPGHVI